MSDGAAQDIIVAIRKDIEDAADALLSAAEQGLRRVQAAREGDLQALDQVEAALCAILEACAFQDLAGQRLTNLSAAVAAGGAGAPPPGDPLLNGPAAHGRGLGQADADALMNGQR